MGAVANMPRIPLRNPYFISMARQKRLCPWCGRPTRLNGMELSADGAYEVCDNPECNYSATLVAPKWARTGGKPAAARPATAKPAPTGAKKPHPPYLRIVK